MIENENPTFEVDAALGEHIRVKLSSGQLVAAGATDDTYLGTTNRQTFAADELVSITPAATPGVKRMVAADAISQYGAFEYAASGKIQALASGAKRGIVLEASTADGDVVRVIEFPPVNGKGAAVASLSQDISATYAEAEVQAISTKVDALLASLRAAGVIAAS